MNGHRQTWRLSVAGLILASATIAAAGASEATTPPKSPAPIVNTGYAEQLGASAAMLRGSISPNGTAVSYYFEYGTTQAYGARTSTTPLGTSGKTIHVAARVSGLTPHTAYHFRLVAVGPAGTTIGADHAFTTAKIPLSVIATATPNPVVFGDSFVISGALSGTDSAAHPVALQANPFPYVSSFKYVTPAELTSTTGTFSFAVHGVLQNTQLRVAANGSPLAKSPPISELVAARVSFHARPAGRRGYVRLYGAVAPSIVGARVAFQWARPNGGVVNVGGTTTKRGTGNAARFSRVLRIRHRGLYRVFVAVANGKQVSGQSRAIAIR